MICPDCQTENRPGANYCHNCGHFFALVCPRCRTLLPEHFTFCDKCGERLRERPPGPPQQGAAQVAARPSAATLPFIPVPVNPSPPGPTAPAASPGGAQHSTVGDLRQAIPLELKRKLETAHAAGGKAGERKQVTVLFTDIVGSTALAEKLDPEDWGEIVAGAHQRVSKAVYEYEGTIAQLLGDGVLAFFGAPITHEDDPVRAVNAALDILKLIGQYNLELRARYPQSDFQMRVGLNTGLVVAGNIGSDLHMEYLAIGDTVNLAARMQTAAEPGTVLISANTARIARHAFVLEPRGEIQVKGKTEPVPVFRVLGRKALAEHGRGIEGLQVEMVGREPELRALQGVMADLKQGVGRIVMLLGEAGLGKTRLLSETHQAFNSLLGPQGDWFETGSLSYETNQAYGLIQRLIRRVEGIAPDDTPQAIRDKLPRLCSNLPEAHRARATVLLETLFGVQSEGEAVLLEGESFRRELLTVIRDWWANRFAGRPTVMVFDDMHWADAASAALLRQLLPLTGEIPLVILCAMRTERQAPAWQIKLAAEDELRHSYLELSLRPLSEAESNELLDRLLAIPELPARLRSSILEKSAGNPFFVEEVVRTLIETGAVVAAERSVKGQTARVWRATNEGADFEIPGSLQSLLASRMDRLEEATRGTLQIAAVIGRTFYRRVLQVVDEAATELDQRVGTLLQLDMIREAARVPEVEYAFRNPLTQEAVYKTILVKRRREFHRRVAQALESLYRERLEGLYGLLIYHLSLAGEHDKAIAYARQAAQQATGLYAYDEALHNLRAALGLTAPDEKSPVRLALLEELADVYRLLRDGMAAIEHYQQALEVCRALSGTDKLTALRLHRKIVQSITELKWTVSLQDLQQADASRRVSVVALEEALRELEGAPPHAERVRALVALSTDAWRIQEPPDWEAAQRFAQTAVDMAEQLDSPVDRSKALGALASVLDGRSLLRAHLAVAEQRLALCRLPTFTDVRETIEAVRGVGAARMYVGEYEQALDLLQEALELAVRAQVIDEQSAALGLRAQCLFRLDRWDELLATELEWRDLERRYPRERVGETCFFVALSSSVYALRGQSEQARVYRDESYNYMVAMSGQPEGWQRNQFY